MPSTGSTAISALKAAPGRPSLPARRLADRHHGVDIDFGERGAHGIERGEPGVLTVAAADPTEGGGRGAFRDPAEREDQTCTVLA